MDAGPVPVEKIAGQIKEFILNYGVHDGHVVKHIWPSAAPQSPQPIVESGVDSSLIGLAVPYQVLQPEHLLMEATIKVIEAGLHRPEGGVYRYKADVYYGGGEWLLLTAWLGWYYAQSGQLEQAESLLGWINSQADLDGQLAEQVSDHTLSPEHLGPWLKKWGPVANPLLWSHAMYIILVNAIEERRAQ